MPWQITSMPNLTSEGWPQAWASAVPSAGKPYKSISQMKTRCTSLWRVFSMTAATLSDFLHALKATGQKRFHQWLSRTRFPNGGRPDRPAIFSAIKHQQHFVVIAHLTQMLSQFPKTGARFFPRPALPCFRLTMCCCPSNPHGYLFVTGGETSRLSSFRLETASPVIPPLRGCDPTITSHFNGARMCIGIRAQRLTIWNS
jgi:hypothetical protein